MIRRATLLDHPQLRELLSELDRLHREAAPWLFQEPETDPRPRSWLQGNLEDPAVAVFVAELDGACIGVTVVRLRHMPDFPVFRPLSYAVIDELMVAQAARRQGIARSLYQACERWAQAQQAAWLEVNVYDFNQEALAFYAALGLAPKTRKLRKPLGK